jgi:hypothetical protein
VRGYSHELKIARDELRDDPFNADARAHLVQLILQDSKIADAAKLPLRRTQAPAVGRAKVTTVLAPDALREQAM